MKRYGIKRSPYTDEEQARAIELLKSGLGQETILDTLAREFPSERARQATLSSKVIKRWLAATPDLPETMRALGYLKNFPAISPAASYVLPTVKRTSFKTIMFDSTVRRMVYAAVTTAMVSTAHWAMSAIVS